MSTPAPVPSTEVAANGRTVLVTGASGFVGRALVTLLAERGWHVRALASRRAGKRGAATTPRSERVEVVPALDLDRDVDWHHVLHGVDAVVHLAGLAHTRGLPEATWMQVNGYATEALAVAARRAGVRRLVLMSSVRAQSGPTASDALTEDRPAEPTDAAGRSKLRGEIGVQGVLGSGATDYVILRPVLIYGHGATGNMSFLARLARSRLPLPLGALTGKRSLLSLANACDAILHVLDRPTASRQTFLVADPGPALDVREMLLAMRAGLERSPTLVPVPTAILRGPARLAGQRQALDTLARPLLVDTRRLETTGWHPTLDTRTGLYLWMRSEAGRRIDD